MEISQDLIDKKIEEYNNYIEEHKKNVIKAYNELADLDSSFIKDEIFADENLSDDLYNRVMNHDDSKYSEEEFDAYRKNFFPVNEEEKENNKADFDKAWEHHWKNNDHHWQYWYRDGKFIKIPNKQTLKVAYIEMVLDYTAMGYKFGDTAYQYYKKNEDKIKIYPELKDYVINLMKALDK